MPAATLLLESLEAIWGVHQSISRVPVFEHLLHLVATFKRLEQLCGSSALKSGPLRSKGGVSDWLPLPNMISTYRKLEGRY